MDRSVTSLWYTVINVYVYMPINAHINHFLSTKFRLAIFPFTSSYRDESWHTRVSSAARGYHKRRIESARDVRNYVSRVLWQFRFRSRCHLGETDTEIETPVRRRYRYDDARSHFPWCAYLKRLERRDAPRRFYRPRSGGAQTWIVKGCGAHDDVGCRTNVTPRRTVAFFNGRIMRIDESHRYGETDTWIEEITWETPQNSSTCRHWSIMRLSLITNCHIHIRIKKDSILSIKWSIYANRRRLMPNIYRRHKLDFFFLNFVCVKSRPLIFRNRIARMCSIIAHSRDLGARTR